MEKGEEAAKEGLKDFLIRIEFQNKRNGGGRGKQVGEARLGKQVGKEVGKEGWGRGWGKRLRKGGWGRGLGK